MCEVEGACVLLSLRVKKKTEGKKREKSFHGSVGSISRLPAAV